MRISQGRTNLDVTSHGFALFVTGLILSTFVGGALKVGLRSERVHERISGELRQRFPRNDVQVGRTEVLLSRGLWPVVGVRAEDLSFSQTVCGKLSFRIEVPEAIVPIDLWSLLTPRVRLGKVALSHARLHLNYQDCDAGARANISTAEGLREAVRTRGIQPPNLTWSDLASHLAGIDLEDLVVSYERNRTWGITIPRAKIRFGTRTSLGAQLIVIKSLAEGELHHDVNLTASGEGDELSWAVHTGFKEGQIEFGGKWNFASNRVSAKAQLTQLPLKDLSGELHQMGFLARDIKAREAWLTCGINWEGPADHPEHDPLIVRGCKLEGAYGRVDMAEGEVDLARETTFRRPATILVQNLQLQPLLEALGVKGLPSLVARPGAWTGTANYSNPRSWHVDGDLNNVEIVFSNLSVRGKQVINKVGLKIIREGANLGVRLERAEVDGGEFKGRVTAQLDLENSDGASGPLAVDVEALRFAPAIQHLLVGGEIAPMTVRGSGHFQHGRVSDLAATIIAPFVRAEGWRAEIPTLRLQIKPGQMRLDATLVRAEANSRFRFYPQLTLTGRAAAGGELAWQHVSATFIFGEMGGTFEPVEAEEVADRTPWKLRGDWVRDGQMHATLAIGKAGRSRSFELAGEQGVVSLKDRQPSSAH